MNERDKHELWYETNLDIFLNRWFANYDAARADLDEHGGFLLPFRHHFFVCRPDVIRALGLNPEDPDWQKISYDCARPADFEAFARLREKRQAIIRDRQQ